MPKHYPIALRVQGERCLIVGGGLVAYRKVISLLECGAIVQIVSPALVPELKELVVEDKVSYEMREFRAEDLGGVFLVIGATNSPELNQEISRLAKERKMLVNIVDQPEECNFIVPAVHRAGALTLSVTTDGKSPALASRIRHELEMLYQYDSYDLLLGWLGEIRSFLLKNVDNSLMRRKVLLKLANSNLKNLVENGENEKAVQLVAELLIDIPESTVLLTRLQQEKFGECPPDLTSEGGTG